MPASEEEKVLRALASWLRGTQEEGGVRSEGRWQGSNTEDFQPWADAGFLPSASSLFLCPIES